MTKERIGRLKSFGPSITAKSMGTRPIGELTKEAYSKLDDNGKTEFLKQFFNVDFKKKEGE